jgi:hypothetical protein
MKKVEYKLISDSDLARFNDQINRWLSLPNSTWQLYFAPTCSVSVTDLGNIVKMYSQALIRETEG